MASTFQISPASRSDIPELVKVALAAFKNDPIFLLMKQHCAPAEIQASDVQSYDRTFSDPGVRFFKAVDTETGQMAAFCKWRFPHTVEKTMVEPEKSKDAVPKGFNQQLHHEFVEKLSASRKQHLDNSKDYFVNMLATNPEYQRKGLGKRLLAYGCEIADNEGARVYLESSKVAQPLYVSMGFAEVGDFEIDLEKFGGEGVEPVKLMVRNPKDDRGDNISSFDAFMI